MKKAYRALGILSAVLLSLSLVSCAAHIEDTNGDDPTPVTLTDADIVQNNTSSVTIGSVSNTVNGKTTSKIGKLSGVSTLSKLKSNGHEVLTVTATLTAGNLRLCLVCDGEIVAEIPIDGTAHTVALPETGTYQLRAAGESAKFTVTYKKGEWPADWDRAG